MPFVWIWNAIYAFFLTVFARLSAFLPEIIARFLYSHGKNYGLFLLYLALLVSLTASYFTLANNVIDALHQTVPQIVLDVWGWFMPGNAVPCFIAVFSARVLKWTYIQKKRVITNRINALTKAGMQS